MVMTGNKRRTFCPKFAPRKKAEDMSKENKLAACCCGSTNLKELAPYGVESVQCQDCKVSLRKQDWNRVMPKSHSVFESDYYSHHFDWVDACKIAKDNAETEEDRAYWQKQLNTLHRLNAELRYE